jgi:hypothetical protein
MSNKMATLAIFLGFAAGTGVACSGTTGQSGQGPAAPVLSVNSPSPSPKLDESQPKSLIRQVDFANFSYPRLPSGKCFMDKVQLKDGKYDSHEEMVPGRASSTGCWSITLSEIHYEDVTGDSQEEAIVILYAERGGTESSQDVYIYGLRGQQPVLLWKFATGDRADGGLRRIYSEKGELVIELYGVGTAIGKDLYDTEDVPDCCPQHYTRTNYKWIENQFRLVGKEEVLQNPSGNANPVMP